MRSVPEWIGKSDDSAIPDRVRLRIFTDCEGRCHCCGRRILVGEPWDCDHVVALINGGQHRESNLKPILKEHHLNKSRDDVAEKARSYKKRKKHYGLKKTKHPMAGSRLSKWKRRMDGTVVPRPPPRNSSDRN